MGKAPRPAKDVKPTDMRSQFLKDAKTAKTKRLAEDMRKKAKAQAADKKVRPAKDITKGDMRSTFLKDAKAGNIKAKPPAPKPGIGSAARVGAARLTGVAGFLLDPSFFDYKGGGKAGEGSDKPSGPLMKGGKLPGYKYLPDRGGGPVKRQGSSSPSIASPKTDREVPKQPKATDFRKKNLEANRKVGQPKTANPKPLTPTAPKKPAFKGNWVGAAPTAMQARGGARIKRSSFADLLKRKG